MPRTVDSEERRAELGAAAARVIARAGIAGVTMREVAAEAGWTTGALTHYFSGKADLLRFTLDTSLSRRRADRPRRDTLPADEALRAALVNALPTDEDSRLHWIVTVAFCAQAVADPDLAEAQRDSYRDFVRDIAHLVTRSGRATTEQATEEAERLIALTDGIAIQALFDPQRWPAPRQVEALDAGLRTPAHQEIP
jgi:AcrR family transcriptional regulator